MRAHLEGRNRERLEIYLKFLVMGAAFAAAEKWSVAIGHAEKAIGLVKRTEDLGEDTILIETEDGKAHLSGREAYFLAAVCKKILADRPDSLRDAEDYLEQSRRRHLRDIEGGDTKRKEQIQLRYFAEELSIAQARYYLTRWTCKNGSLGGICDDPSGDACGSCRSAFEALETEADRLWKLPERTHYLIDPDAPSLSDMSVASTSFSCTPFAPASVPCPQTWYLNPRAKRIGGIRAVCKGPWPVWIQSPPTSNGW